MTNFIPSTTFSILALYFLSQLGFPLLGQPSLNMQALGQWDDNTLVLHGGISYSDVWGYAANGREYGLIGSSRFVHILDITDPTDILEVGRFNNFSASNSLWRDIKTYQQYAYCVADQRAEGLQIIDLSNLPTSASIVYQSTAFFDKTHNVFIDEAAARLYVFGSNTRGNGVIILSLADPTNPTLLASIPLNGGYMHDGYARGDTLYANHGNVGLYIYDVSIPSMPIELGRLTGYPEAGYNHSCWLTDNGNHLVFCDETQGTAVKIADVSDPSDMGVTDLFRSVLEAPAATNSLAHNPIVIGDSLVFISYYDDGIQVFDISDPNEVALLAYYDTNPDNVGTYPGDGSWGVYPLLPSGRILASDVLNGLFVLEYIGFSVPLPVDYLSWEVKASGKNSAHLRWTTATETNNRGFELEHSQDGRQFQRIARVAAQATEGEGAAYSYLHTGLEAGTHYYRLRQIDHDGRYEYSPIASLRIQNEQQGKIWPNPLAKGQALQGRENILECYNSLGQAVDFQQISALPGTYWLLDKQGQWHPLVVE